jgi:hypothetical protein
MRDNIAAIATIVLEVSAKDSMSTSWINFWY